MYKNSQNPLTGSRGDICTEKGIVPTKRKKIRYHFSGTHQTERTFFHLSACKITRLFANSQGFACGLCLLLVN